MKDCCLPKCLMVCKPVSGKRSAGGQYRRWMDLLISDLKRLELLEDWKETVQERCIWRCFVMEALADLNEHMERQEKESKDARKMRRENDVLSESLA